MKVKSKGELTRQTIVDQSLQLFSVKGYYNTSIKDVLEATGLTKGGLYGHFTSKEEIWHAVYDHAVSIWRSLVFKDVRRCSDPLERLDAFIKNDLENYLGGEVFDGGCFFLNMLVELSGQSASMSKQILRGFVRLSRLLRLWLEEAMDSGQVAADADPREIANFIVISLNGAAALYISSRDRTIIHQTVNQLHCYVQNLRE
ncbi:MAG: TetR/AcrR family transcriptional regulator [Thermodesulfobacteriota bacterium]